MYYFRFLLSNYKFIPIVTLRPSESQLLDLFLIHHRLNDPSVQAAAAGAKRTPLPYSCPPPLRNLIPVSQQ